MWNTIVKVSIASLLANKMRTFLSMLGILIGVGAVVTMLAIGSGAQQQILARISAMGTNLLIVRPGQRGTGGVASGLQQNLTLADAEALFRTESAIYQLAPVVSGSAQLKYLNNNSRSNVVGSSMTYFSIRNFEIGRGRAFSEAEAEGLARVAVIGPVTAENLFGERDPLQQAIKVNGINFTVVGVLKSKGDQGWFNPDDQVVVPYTTAMKQIFGVESLREIDIQAGPGTNLDQLQQAVTRILRQRHRLQEDVPEDFDVRNQAEILETASSVSQTFTMLLGGIASISLLVGGIGIMNIMLVSVTERTREIGLRKAIGATRGHILQQFLVEAILVSSLGGLIGASLGIGSSFLMARFTEFAIRVQWPGVALALSFSMCVGIFFGYYPARRAAILDPIESLRHE